MCDPVPLCPADLAHGLAAPLLALNNAHATELSWLQAERLQNMVRHAFVAWRIGEADALLIAFDQTAAYGSPNFLWFRARFPRFVYVDRVVVAPALRRCGYARRLYAGLFAAAARAGHVLVGCEVNAMPPNPQSDEFHAALGFTAVGGATTAGGKTVRYLLRPVSPG